MIKSLIVLFVSLLCFITFQKEVYAHSRGVPILKINGVLTKVYPIESSSIEPYLGDSSDVSSEKYLVNQNLDFDFEASRSAEVMEPIRGQNLEKVTYIWNFGDGSGEQKSTTPQKRHTYTKMGSYIMEIVADFSQTSTADYPKQIVQSTLIHILPSKDYKLPEPIIKINGQIVPGDNSVLGNFPKEVIGDSPFARLRANSRERLEFDFNKRLSFDASNSKSASSRIIQYQWDLGQGDVEKNKNASIKYKLPQALTTAVLRVKDENGFIAEAAVDLENSGKNEPSGFSLEETISPTILIVLTQVAALVIGITWYLRRKRKKI